MGMLTSWCTRMALDKKIMPELCADNSSLTEEDADEHAHQVMQSFIKNASSGVIFTGTPPEVSNYSCVAYPKKEAPFCSSLGHSHMVHPVFKNHNYAALRSS